MRYREVSDETKSLFEQILNTRALPRTVKFVLVNDEKSKSPAKLQKINDLSKYLTSSDLVVIINEELMDLLNTEQKLICLEESIQGVVYDMQNDRLKYEAEDFTTYSSLIKKHTSQKLIQIKESISVYLKQKEETEKENKKNNKKK